MAHILSALSLSQVVLFTCRAEFYVDVVNNCDEAVWIGLNMECNGCTLPTLTDNGKVDSDSQITITFEDDSVTSGVIWPRTRCDFSEHSGDGAYTCCALGDCSCEPVCQPDESIKIGPGYGFSQAEFTFNGADGSDNYDISNINGFHLPITMRPIKRLEL